MKSKIGIFKDYAVTRLESTEFKRLAFLAKSEYIANDIIEFSKQDGAFVWFNFTRNIKFIPESIFEITVTISVKRELKSKFLNDFDANTFLQSLDEDDLINLGQGAFSRLSSIISSLTALDNLNVLVTAPVPYLNTDEE